MYIYNSYAIAILLFSVFHENYCSTVRIESTFIKMGDTQIYLGKALGHPHQSFM